MYEPMIYIMYSKKCDFACSVVGGSTAGIELSNNVSKLSPRLWRNEKMSPFCSQPSAIAH